MVLYTFCTGGCWYLPNEYAGLCKRNDPYLSRNAEHVCRNCTGFAELRQNVFRIIIPCRLLDLFSKSRHYRTIQQSNVQTSFTYTRAHMYILKKIITIIIITIIEGSLEVKHPTIWTDEKQSREEAERRERSEERRVEEKSQKKADADARKGRKVAKHCVFRMIWGSGGWKSRLAKAAGAEPSGEMRDEKLHAVVARSTFPSQNVQSTPFSDHFWKLRCRKSARRCGAKHISKSKCTKHTILGPLLEVEMSKKCTPLWREAHFQVKMYKAHHSRSTFGSWDVEKVHAVVARSTFPSQNV